MNGSNSGGDIRVENRFTKWFENYWYHNKWKTIGALFLAFVLIVCITQCARREKTDVVVLYAGPHLYVGNEPLTVKAELNAVMPSDFNGDGEKITGLVTYQVMSEEQLKAYNEKLNENVGNDGEFSMVDTSYFTTQMQNYSNYILTGECAILLVDTELFIKLRDMDRLRNLEEVFAVLPKSAIGEYGINFAETALAKGSEQLGRLPDDTVLCLLRPYVMGDISDSTTYTNITNMFVAMAKD